MRGILDRNYERAKETILRNRNRLVKLVERLIEKETLDRDEFEALMNEEAPGTETPLPALAPEGSVSR